ncbi:proline dehydrogenase family protein [Paenibacillus sp. FSL M7-1455]|jgi:proline dehydrogenase|uniref:proline dehydrogenase n=1 Tax=Paenibacillus cookii TaxID=157839 RepID=A0ABQ4LVC5_9BACL|nr:proline dehydrogenase family protein [Paenibacillus cookii]GIO67236.1 proline dehydrogenase [Paenibacillus cookii]
MNHEPDWERRLADALKSVARRPDVKSFVEQTPWLYQLLRRAARQYVAGEERRDGLDAAGKLADMGYRTSLEYIGENTIDRAVCQAAAEELKTIIRELNGAGDRVCFDLSHIGLSVDTDLAYRLLTELAEEALRVEAELLISMEESAKTDRILDVYRQAASRYPNIGITLQAHLHRTRQDLADLSHSPRRIRIVKGAFREPEGQALPRSAALNDRYLELVHDAIRQGHHVSIATHDEQIINEAIRRGWLDAGNAEFDMLYGFRPGLAAKLRAAGFPVRIYITYGQEWFLYLCHRIAEYPPHLYRAVADMAGGEAADPCLAYELQTQ